MAGRRLVSTFYPRTRNYRRNGNILDVSSQNTSLIVAEAVTIIVAAAVILAHLKSMHQMVTSVDFFAAAAPN